ncbi:MAG: ATP-binding protein [Bryobacteraceae bacterium]
MRSVYAKVLLWCLGSLLFSLAALVGISRYINGRAFEGQNPFQGMASYLLDDCVREWEAGGKPALEAMLKRQGQQFRLQLRVTDIRGIELLTGEDLSSLLREPGIRRANGRLEQIVTTRNGRYRAVALLFPPPFQPWTYAPYYILLLFTLAGLCWLLAVNIASPLRQLSNAVERFGAGDLDARFPSVRRDEIGDLARSFNQMAERLQTLRTAERRLIQDISHELRSPLARLSFAAELVRSATDKDRAVARLKREIERLSVLVSGLLEVASAEGESTEKGLAGVRIELLLAEILESCEIEASARPCRLERKLTGQATLHGHADLLRRAFENVISNAIRYSPQDGVVRVHAMVENSNAMVTIQDLGPGVPDDMLQQIFTPFFRVDEARDSSTGGIGLGLAIAQRAIFLHHGQIKAENTHPGLRVSIEIPLVPSRNQPTSPLTR